MNKHSNGSKYSRLRIYSASRPNTSVSSSGSIDAPHRQQAQASPRRQINDIYFMPSGTIHRAAYAPMYHPKIWGLENFNLSEE